MSGNTVSADFTIAAVSLLSDGSTLGNQNARRFDQMTLAVNGEELRYLGVQVEKSFHWKTSATYDICSITLTDSHRHETHTPIQPDDSDWSICRLLDKAQQVTPVGDHYRVVWSFPDLGLRAEFTLKMDNGARCPFLHGSTFRTFRLPSSVVQ